ncbi:MAG: hypothetical protein ACOX9E_09860, partial [Lentisphaeria bacterium]
MDTMDDNTCSLLTHAACLHVESAWCPAVLRACSPQRNITPQTKPQAHAGANRAVGLQPAAEHHPANE